MPRAEVTWNGVAKSYRVGSEVFMQNRSRTEDWPEDLVKYLKATKGFSVVDKPPVKKVEAKPAAPAEEPEVTTSASTDEEEKPSRSSGPSRARRRSSS